MWWISISLGIVAALLHWPIVEERLTRPIAVPQPAWQRERRLAFHAAVGRRRPGDRGGCRLLRPVGRERSRLPGRPDRRLLPV